MFSKKVNIEFSELNTDRLVLTEINESDADDIYKIYFDYDVIRLTDSNLHFSVDDSRNFITSIQQQSTDKIAIYWGLKLRTTGRIIGVIGIYHIDQKHFFASVSCILAKEFWRQGYTTEALKEIISFAFNNMKLNRLEAQIYVHHDASVNLFEKLLFTREAMLRENFHIEWKHENSYMYSMLKSDFDSFTHYYKK